MLKIFPFAGGIAIILLAAGCGVKAETYVMEKPRVGVEYSGGNAGYLKGKPQFVEPAKKTRKVYILELTKAVPETPSKKIHEETMTSTRQTIVVPPPEESEAVPQALAEDGSEEAEAMPAAHMAEESAAAAPAVEGPREAVTYTVQKDDTLQKIAKKFYGSYGKWTKIYDANKENLRNPNFVRPGTVLTIPAADS